jgi:hypothetical protein
VGSVRRRGVARVSGIAKILLTKSRTISLRLQNHFLCARCKHASSDQVQVVEYAVLPQRLAIWDAVKNAFRLLLRRRSLLLIWKKEIESYQSLILRKSRRPIENVSRRTFTTLNSPASSLIKPPSSVCCRTKVCISGVCHTPVAERQISARRLCFVLSAQRIRFVVATENARNKERSNLETVLSNRQSGF